MKRQTKPEKRDDFTRGMVCAAAILARESDPTDTQVRMLIGCAGGPQKVMKHGDPEDLEVLFPDGTKRWVCFACGDRWEGQKQDCPSCGCPRINQAGEDARTPVSEAGGTPTLPTNDVPMIDLEVVPEETMRWVCLGCKHKWPVPVSKVPKQGCPACGSPQIIDINVAPVGRMLR